MSRRVSINVLPLWAALLPLLTFNVCYLIAAALEHVPSCIPYLDGCTSVSSTGRSTPESLVFKLGMLASAVLLAFVWHRTAAFLRASGQSLLRVSVLRLFAALAVVSLIVYAVTLGMREEEYRALRRIGIDGFAFSNLLTQITFAVLYRPLQTDATKKLFRWLVILCFILPLLGVAAEVAKSFGLPRRATNNAVAWNASLVVAAYYAVVARVWWHHKIASGRPASPSE